MCCSSSIRSSPHAVTAISNALRSSSSSSSSSPSVLTRCVRVVLVVLGCGGEIESVEEKLHGAHSFALHGVAFEALATDDACSTFNLISEEGRRVIGAFLTQTDKKL